MRTTESTAGHARGPFFWTCLAIGWGVIIFGLQGIVSADGTNPPALFRLLVGLNVVNDAIVAPLVIVAAVAVRRVLPRWAVVPADVGLIASSTVLLYAYPLIGGWGRTVRAGFSRLPFDYVHSVLMVLGAIWVVCALLGVVTWRRARASAP